jgi:uncharacterized protein YgbK (DUF1537 family)
MTNPRYGWYGDDFTGATDTLATLAQAGLRSLLFLQLPTQRQLEAAGELDAIGIAGSARAMAPDAMRAELEPVGRFFAAAGVEIMHYKCCSTFDSAPHVGSIGAAAGTLRRFFANPLLAIVGGQPSLGRYCLFSNLYAAAEAGGQVERIDRHPTMMRHPVTPMGEADLRLHLGLQGLITTPVHYPGYASGRLSDLIDRELTGGSAAVLFDVTGAGDLALIGSELWRRAHHAPLLCVGASSVAQALTRGWNGQGDRRDAGRAAVPALPRASGPVFVMAGSLSPVTARQIEAARSHYRVIAADGRRFVDDEAFRMALSEQVVGDLQRGRHVLLSTAPDGIDGFDRKLSARVAERSATFLANLLQRVRLRRVGIAGGDTSSRAICALPAWGLSYLTSIAPGVAVSTLRSDQDWLDGTEVMLKGGQMGPADIFATFARRSDA